MLIVDRLEVSYAGIRALWDISMEVKKGESVALIGANGAGKSTLLKAVMGLLPVQSGRILINGVPVNGAKPHEIVRRGVAYVPEGRRIFPYMTVEENLSLGASAEKARVEKAKTLKSFYELFPILGRRSNQLAGTLSGGEQQMLAIGRALMAMPRLLLLDEPSFGLAPVVLSEVFKALGEINKTGVAILLAEQNVPEALALTEKAYVIENGKLVLEGRSEELLADERVRSAYIGG